MTERVAARASPARRRSSRRARGAARNRRDARAGTPACTRGRRRTPAPSKPGGESDQRGVQERSRPRIRRSSGGAIAPSAAASGDARPVRLPSRRSLVGDAARRWGGSRSPRVIKAKSIKTATLRVFGGAEPLRERLARDAEVLRRQRPVAAGRSRARAGCAPARSPPASGSRSPSLRPAASALGAGGALSAAATSSGGRCAVRSTLVVVHQHRAADDGAQLAHVAGPAVGGEQRRGLGRDRREAPPELARRRRRGSARPARGMSSGRSRSGGRCAR